MEILKQIESKNKVHRVIESCTTYSHTISAKKMVQLYYDKFEDLLGEQELTYKLNNLKLQNV